MIVMTEESVPAPAPRSVPRTKTINAALVDVQLQAPTDAFKLLWIPSLHTVALRCVVF